MVKKILRGASVAVVCGAFAAPAFCQDQPPQGQGPGQNQPQGQEGRRGRGGARGGQEGGARAGNIDPAEMRQRMEERVKEMLGVDDTAWKAIQPKLEKVQRLQREAGEGRIGGMFMFAGRGGFGGGGGGFGGPGGRPEGRPEGAARAEGGAGRPEGGPPGGGDAARPEGGRRFRGGQGGGEGAGAPPESAEKSRALMEAVRDKDAKDEDVKAKLAAVREARAKAKGELTKAQTELKEGLTPKQEAALVVLGYLD